jgi:hypothetical protein
MHPTIQIEIARTRVADMRRQAERDGVARAARASRASRPERKPPWSARHRPAPRTLAQRLLRSS